MKREQIIDQMIEKCLEQDQRAYEEIRAQFKERIACADVGPETSRIQELERIWSELNQKRKATASDTIQTLLANIDEAELIESKKVNTEKEG